MQDTPSEPIWNGFVDGWSHGSPYHQPRYSGRLAGRAWARHIPDIYRARTNRRLPLLSDKYSTINQTLSHMCFPTYNKDNNFVVNHFSCPIFYFRYYFYFSRCMKWTLSQKKGKAVSVIAISKQIYQETVLKSMLYLNWYFPTLSAIL
jgi:hypothetical protein